MDNEEKSIDINDSNIEKHATKQEYGKIKTNNYENKKVKKYKHHETKKPEKTKQSENKRNRNNNKKDTNGPDIENDNIHGVYICCYVNNDCCDPCNKCCHSCNKCCHPCNNCINDYCKLCYECRKPCIDCSNEYCNNCCKWGCEISSNFCELLIKIIDCCCNGDCCDCDD